ncbi:MAG: hypothetical protein LAP85_15245 [Acidobacteriia bacterium]|nr:hypothetical protein [Terriglobia bacterium]
MSFRSGLNKIFAIRLSPHQRFAVWSIVILYAIATLSFLGNILSADEWRTKYVSMWFLVTVILIPFVSIAFSCAIQIVTLFMDMRSRELQYSRQSQFMAALEQCRDSSVVSRAFLTYLLQDWAVCMAKLQNGVVTIQSNYWSVCANLYDFAHDSVECTSLVPLKYWDELNPIDSNKELLDYKDLQVRKLIAHGVKVKRTFILHKSDYSVREDCDRFLSIVTRQMTEGFMIYFIIVDDFDLQPELKDALLKDFALIDDKILMLGRVSGLNQSVYHYDFFELQTIQKDPALFQPALRVFKNPNNVVAGDRPELLIATHRKKIDQFEKLADASYLAEKQAIGQHITRLKY